MKSIKFFFDHNFFVLLSFLQSFHWRLSYATHSIVFGEQGVPWYFFTYLWAVSYRDRTGQAFKAAWTEPCSPLALLLLHSDIAMTATFTWVWNLKTGIGIVIVLVVWKRSEPTKGNKNKGFHNGCDIHSHLYLWACICIRRYLYLCGMACKSQDLRLSTMLFIALSRFVAVRSRCFCTWSGFIFLYFLRSRGLSGSFIVYSAELLKTLRKIWGKIGTREMFPGWDAQACLRFSSVIYLNHFLGPFLNSPFRFFFLF